MPRLPITRDTRQKRAIRNAFKLADRPLSPEQARAVAARESDGLGIATVYRTVKSLLEDGHLTVVDVPGRGTYYELAGKGHHHHFACEDCEAVFELEGCTSEVRGRLPRGFRARGHDVTVFGTCPDCSATARRARGSARRTRSHRS